MGYIFNENEENEYRTVLLRRAGREDAEGISELEKQCFARPWSLASLQESFDAGAEFFVAEDAGHICAYAGVYLIPPEGHMANIAVESRYRRKGVGYAMLGYLLSECERKGIEDFTLEVRPSNEAAIALYEKYGFAEEGRRRAYYDDNGEDAVIMWRRGEDLAQKHV